MIRMPVRSKTHEYMNARYDLHVSEPELHNDRRKLRRASRNRLRYRKPRFDNRQEMTVKDGFVPSIRKRRDCHILLFAGYAKVLPVTNAVFEMGQFDSRC